VGGGVGQCGRGSWAWAILTPMSECTGRDVPGFLARFMTGKPWVDGLALGFLAVVGAALVGAVGGIPAPYIHDEFAYLLMGETFALGRLTNPTPPFWEHLEAFHVLMVPTYMGKYPPAQGLVLALGFLLGHPIVGVWISSGFMVWAVTWMLQPWIGRKWALIGGALTLLNLGLASPWAQSYWGGAVAAVGGAVTYGAIRRAWNMPGPGSGIVLGVGLLILANSRPFEGLLVSLPALAVAVVIGKDRRFGVGRKGPFFAGLISVVVLGFSGMGLYNLAVTGDPLRMPYSEYQAQYATAPNLLLAPVTEVPPEYRHEEFEDFWAEWDLGRYRKMTTPIGFLRTRGETFLSFFQLLGPITLGFLFLGSGIKDSFVRITILGSGLVLGGVLLLKGAFPHYLAPAVGPLMYIVLEGWKRMVSRESHEFNGPRVFRIAAVMAIAVAIGYLLVFLTQGTVPSQARREQVAACLESLPFPSLVLVDYPGVLAHGADWIRNGPDPFETKIVWARSMGPRNDEAIMAGTPDRAVWRASADPAHPTTDWLLGDATRSVDLLRYPLGLFPSSGLEPIPCR